MELITIGYESNSITFCAAKGTYAAIIRTLGKADYLQSSERAKYKFFVSLKDVKYVIKANSQAKGPNFGF